MSELGIIIICRRGAIFLVLPLASLLSNSVMLGNGHKLCEGAGVLVGDEAEKKFPGVPGESKIGLI